MTIHILTMDQAGLKPADIDQIARDFEAKNPDIKVVMEYVGYDYVHDKIVTGMAAKPPAYDAAMIDVIWPDEFIKAGYLLDVTSRSHPRDEIGIFPAAWNGVTRNGKVYGMPWLMDVKYFMYNKDMLATSRFQCSAQDLGRTGRAGQGHQGERPGRIPDHLVVEPEGRCCLRLHRPAVRQWWRIPGCQWQAGLQQRERCSGLGLDEADHRRWPDQSERGLVG